VAMILQLSANLRGRELQKKVDGIMGHTSELKCSKLLVKRTWDLIAQIVEQRRFVIDSTDSISLNFTTVRFPP